MDKQSYRVYRGYIGIMEKKMETMIIMALYWCCTGIMENEMETTILFSITYRSAPKQTASSKLPKYDDIH